MRLNQPMEDGDCFEMYNDCLVIRLGNDLDHHKAMELRQMADYWIEVKGAKRIVFDFAKVGFMDSSGIGMIMGRYRKIIFTGGKVALCCVCPAVDRVFRMSGLYKIMDKYDDLDTAISEL